MTDEAHLKIEKQQECKPIASVCVCIALAHRRARAHTPAKWTNDSNWKNQLGSGDRNANWAWAPAHMLCGVQANVTQQQKATAKSLQIELQFEIKWFWNDYKKTRLFMCSLSNK